MAFPCWLRVQVADVVPPTPGIRPSVRAKRPVLARRWQDHHMHMFAKERVVFSYSTIHIILPPVITSLCHEFMAIWYHEHFLKSMRRHFPHCHHQYKKSLSSMHSSHEKETHYSKEPAAIEANCNCEQQECKNRVLHVVIMAIKIEKSDRAVWIVCWLMGRVVVVVNCIDRIV